MCFKKSSFFLYCIFWNRNMIISLAIFISNMWQYVFVFFKTLSPLIQYILSLVILLKYYWFHLFKILHYGSFITLPFNYLINLLMYFHSGMKSVAVSPAVQLLQSNVQMAVWGNSTAERVQLNFKFRAPLL